MIIDQHHLILPQWHVPRGVRVVSTTRQPGASEGVYAHNNLSSWCGDNPEAVTKNWRTLQHSLDYDSLATVRQVHGNRVVHASEAMSQDCEADAIWSDLPGVACSILTADCLPIVLVNAEGSHIAVAHCGWRGLANHILANTLLHFPGKNNIQAWIGPAICARCYQVDEQLYNCFTDYRECFIADGTEHWRCDLMAIAKKQLAELGVSQIHESGLCTYGRSEQFYSYRREGQTGRIATLAWLTED